MEVNFLVLIIKLRKCNTLAFRKPCTILKTNFVSLKLFQNKKIFK